MAIPVPTIDPTGMTIPTYQEILDAIETDYRAIYGADIVITPDSQDGQFLAILALAFYNNYDSQLAVYNAFSPDFSQGAGLSSLVKLDGIQRQAASNSTADVTLVGVAGTEILNGVVRDVNNFLWDLPASVTIGITGEVTVTATAQMQGALAAMPGTINAIFTQTRGWQSVTNDDAATPGGAVEVDAVLRQRQALSVATPGQAIIDSIYGAVANVAGVTLVSIYENATGITDANGVPAHSIAAVVNGGDLQDIVDAIGVRKPPGIQTYGDVSGYYTSEVGLQTQINFFNLTDVAIYIDVEIEALNGYTATIGTAAIQALSDFVNGLGVGVDVYYDWLLGPVSPSANANNRTFKVTALTVGTAPSPVGVVDVVIPYGSRATNIIANINWVVT